MCSKPGINQPGIANVNKDRYQGEGMTPASKICGDSRLEELLETQLLTSRTYCTCVLPYFRV